MIIMGICVMLMTISANLEKSISVDNHFNDVWLHQTSLVKVQKKGDRYANKEKEK